MGVVAGGLAIKFLGWVWIDPLVTILISLYILRETWLIIRKTVDILMQSSAELDYEAIKQDVESIEHINNIHHIHTWLIDEHTIHFEAHLDMDDMSLCEAQSITGLIEQKLIQDYGVSHVTLQSEVNMCHDKNLFRT